MPPQTPQSITSFNGNSLNSASYRTVYKNPGDMPEAVIVFIEQAQADSVNSGTYTVGQRDVYLGIRIKGTKGPVANALREQANRWFKRGTRGLLIAVFDDGVSYQLDCSVKVIVKSPDDDLVHIAHLVSADSDWRATTPDTASVWNPSGAGGSTNITVNGTEPTRMSLTLTPTAAPSGVWLWQNIVQLINVPGVAVGYKSYCITLDTAALVDAGQCLEDCSDFRLSDGGKDTKRFIVNPNTSTTNIWFDITLAAGFALTLSGGTAQVETATAVGTISGAGNATVIVTAAGMTGSPKTFNVAVANTDTPSKWSAKVRAALAADSAVIALFNVKGSGPTIVLVRKAPAGNDSTLNISLANGTCTGITAAPTSANTTAGSLYSLDNSTDYPTLNFAVSAATRAAINALPARFILAHGTEWFSCKRIATSALLCQVSVVQRGALGTDKQAHNGGDVFYYIEHPLVLYSGNSAAPDPTTATGYNNTMPVFSLASSDNTKEVVTVSDLFYDPSYPNKPGTWAPFHPPVAGRNSHPYKITGDASSGAPALGIKCAPYQSGTSWIADVIQTGHQRNDERKFRRITFTGRKYRSGAAWPGTAELQYKDPSGNWQTIFSEATPASAATWTAWGAHTNVDIPDSPSLRLLFKGSSGVVASSYQMLEALTATLYYTTANIPSLTLLGWKSNYYLDVQLTNAATIDGVTYSDAIQITVPMLLNKALVMDGEAYTCQLDGINAHSAMSLDDESRVVWLRAWPGVTNTLSIAPVSNQSIGTLAMTPSYYRRRS